MTMTTLMRGIVIVPPPPSSPSAGFQRQCVHGGGRGDVRPYDHVPIRTVFPSHDPPSDCPGENALSNPGSNQSENLSGNPSKDPSNGQAWERREACATAAASAVAGRASSSSPVPPASTFSLPTAIGLYPTPQPMLSSATPVDRRSSYIRQPKEGGGQAHQPQYMHIRSIQVILSVSLCKNTLLHNHILILTLPLPLALNCKS